jgi:hypothetical protein
MFNIPTKFSGPPQDGQFEKGDMFGNSNARPGGYAGWICLQSGIAAPQWFHHHPYKPFERVSSNGHVYECRNPGTSGTHPINGESQNVGDGSVTWAYVGPAALFAPFGRIEQ